MTGQDAGYKQSRRICRSTDGPSAVNSRKNSEHTSHEPSALRVH
jgi:hypothetical protein